MSKVTSNSKIRMIELVYGVYVMYYVPAMVFLQSIKNTNQNQGEWTFEKKFLYYLSYCMIVFGTIIFIMGMIYTFL